MKWSLQNDPLNQIYLCNCGLMYKPIFNLNESLSTHNVYTINSWNRNDKNHKKRLYDLTNKVTNFKKIENTTKILDIGAGLGMLADAVFEKNPHFSTLNYIALEPVKELALKLNEKVIVVNNDINNANLPLKFFDIIFVCGVDYLFQDITQAFEKIKNSLKKNGIIVIQRNVFIDQTGYVGKNVKNIADLILDNNLIRNWFHSDQYKIYLEKYFDIEDFGREYTSSSISNYFMDTYICGHKKITQKTQQEKNFFAESLKIIQRLMK